MGIYGNKTFRMEGAYKVHPQYLPLHVGMNPSILNMMIIKS